MFIVIKSSAYCDFVSVVFAHFASENVRFRINQALLATVIISLFLLVSTYVIIKESTIKITSLKQYTTQNTRRRKCHLFFS